VVAAAFFSFVVSFLCAVVHSFLLFFCASACTRLFARMPLSIQPYKRVVVGEPLKFVHRRAYRLDLCVCVRVEIISSNNDERYARRSSLWSFLGRLKLKMFNFLILTVGPKVYCLHYTTKFLTFKLDYE
jgi:hypothetical protein